MIRICGAGPGNPDYYTKRMLDLLETEENIIAFERIAEDIKAYRDDVHVITTVNQAVELLDKFQGGMLLASGDPNFFGIVELIKRKNFKIEEVVPGISSVQYLFSKLQRSYSNIQTMSVHGRELDMNNIDPSSDYSFLIDSKYGVNYLSQEFKKAGYKGKLIVGYDLSYENEEIFTVDIGDEIEESSDLGVVVTDFEMD